MPIEFRCPSCSKLLRTPDDSAGKRAKCPQCANVVDVPQASSGGVGLGPLDQLGPIPPDLGGGSPADKSPFSSTGSANPYASPSISGPSGVQVPVDDPQRTGLPWDRGPRSLRTYWETVKFIFSKPTEAFTQMSRVGGFGPPLMFALIGGVVGAFFTGIYQTIMQIVFAYVLPNAGQNMPPGAPGSTLQIALALPMSLLMGTVMVVIGMFVFSAMYHVLLMIVGGANHSFETTFRVSSYVQGTMALFQILPFCGGWIAGILAIVYTILGFAAAHQISGGRAAVAVLIPVIVCGGAALAIAIAVIVAAASQAGNL